MWSLDDGLDIPTSIPPGTTSSLLDTDPLYDITLYGIFYDLIETESFTALPDATCWQTRKLGVFT